MIILGIETSCDETACGIVNDKRHTLANVLYSQFTEHAPYGGVVPEIAARAHLEKLPIIVEEALSQAKITKEEVDLIAFTRGPGLMGPLLVGSSFAKGLASQLKKPMIGVNHLEGHIAAAYLSQKELQPPFLALTVSGGHTELTDCKPGFAFELLGRTRDDAAGEAFDKSGKLLGLGYPAGPLLSQKANSHNRKFHRFPRAFRGEKHGDFSFSGLKTAVLRYTQTHNPEFLQENLCDICASLESAIVEALVEKTLWALRKTRRKTLVVCGGVSANSHLRERLKEEGKKIGVEVVVPALSFCTDNGAMIACAGYERFQHNPSDLPGAIKPGLTLYQ